jgi:hypothetical protein
VSRNKKTALERLEVMQEVRAERRVTEDLKRLRGLTTD